MKYHIKTPRTAGQMCDVFPDSEMETDRTSWTFRKGRGMEYLY